MVYPAFDIPLALEKVRQINSVIQSQKARLNRFGFRNGYLGISVFCYLYGLHTGQKSHLRQSAKYFDIACEAINIDPTISFPYDLSDLGIVCQYLVRGGVLNLSPNVFLEDVDQFLLKRMRFEVDQNNIMGFSRGAAGYGLYFLHRASYDPHSSKIILAEFFSAVRDHADFDKSEYDNPHSPDSPDSSDPLDELNLSCGAGSVILLISRMAESGWIIDSEMALICNRLVEFILSKYPCHSDLAKTFCFQQGNLGIGYALLRTGAAFHQPRCSEKGEQILRQCANAIVLESASLANTSMRNGFSGAALVFERAYKLTRKDLFNHAAEFCFKALLEFEAPQQDVVPLVEPDLSFMDGIAGEGAGLIKAIDRQNIDFGELLWLI
ncbi:lanthionine synthetase LanC family protein [Dyadobacter jiangsuensis]